MTLVIKKEGIFTSLQGLGRFGSQRFGIPPRGAMDRTAARIVNLIIANDETDPVFEFYFPGPEIVFENDHTFALGGADFAAELDGKPVGNWQPVNANATSVLRFRRKNAGNICYLAVGGGLLIGPADRQDDILTERLRSGQKLLTDRGVGPPSPPQLNRRLSREILPAYSPFPTLRILAGAEFSMLPESDNRLIEASHFTVSNESNRMGFRLHGPRLTLAEPVDLVSAAVSFGTIQLLPDGQLVVLMADHQTSGGYPRVGHVISADLPLIAQLGPGNKISFKIVDIAEAERANARLEMDLKKLKIGVGFGRYW